MTWFMGIDIGSENSKGVIIKDGQPVAHYSCPSGINYSKTSERLRDTLLANADLSSDDISFTVATGLGAANVAFHDEKVSDLVCSAKGIIRFIPPAKTVVEIGARSSRVMKIDNKKGKLIDFSVTDKCVAGSYYFIQVVANVLRVSLEQAAALSLESENPITFNTGCAVFGETEAITRVVEGVCRQDILAGAHKALADKIFSLASKTGMKGKCTVIGGGALDAGLLESIKKKTGAEILVPPLPLIVTATGAAVIAGEKHEHSLHRQQH